VLLSKCVAFCVMDDSTPVARLCVGDVALGARVVGMQVEPSCDAGGASIPGCISARDVNSSLNGSIAALEVPELEVKSDYDCFFAGIVTDLVARKVGVGGDFMHKKIIVSAGPYRPYNILWETVGDSLKVDFYSVCRYQQDEDFAIGLVDLMGVL
jgi:hypothetical protein